MDSNNVLLQLEECIKNLYSSSSNEEIRRYDSYLSNFIVIDNFQLLKLLLYKSSSTNAKFYAANGLISLITQNYMTISIEEKIEIYDCLLLYIQATCEELFLHSRFLLNILITLLCRIVRVSWLQSARFKEIFDDTLKIVKEESTFSMIIPFLIFSELVYQFQSPSLPPKNKLYRVISDFKENTLLSIYDYSTNFLVNIFKQTVKFEKFEHCLIFINEISRCIAECMEYEEDLNSKDENYKKYEIKPIYVPNNKKRSRDKTLDIDSIILICHSLFETHNIISKLVKDQSITIDSIKTDQCLCLLQKFLTIKIFYLGDSKAIFLKNFQQGISDLLLTKIGLDNERNLEEFCKLIYMLKKNFSVVELLENLDFLQEIYQFTLECIKYYPQSVPGLIYLIRFFGYFSNMIVCNPLPHKDDLQGLLKELVSALMKKIISSIDESLECDISLSDENLFNDLIDAFAFISRGIYLDVNISFIEVYDSILLTLTTQCSGVIPTTLLTKLNYILFLSMATISFNHRILYEKQFMNKILDNEENLHLDLCAIRDGELCDLSDLQVTGQVFSKIFQILDYYANIIKLNNNGNSNSNNNSNMNSSNFLEVLETGIFFFLKNFCKHFLNRNLVNKLVSTFSILGEILKLSDNSLILSFIINCLIEICRISKKYKSLQNVIKIFQLLEENSYVQIDTHTDDKLIFIGKLYLHPDFLTSILELHGTLTSLNPVDLGKYRTIFYRSIMKIVLLKTSINNEILNTVLGFYIARIDIAERDPSEENNLNVLGYLRDLLGISSAIVLKSDYKFFMEKIFQSLVSIKDIHKRSRGENNLLYTHITNAFLKLVESITNNQYDKVYFHMNSNLPVQLIDLVYEIGKNFREAIAEMEISNSNEQYYRQIKPISLFLRIYRNIFSGKYIQLGALTSVHQSLIEDIFKFLMSLIFSIKFEDFLGYLPKTKVAYYIMKTAFCEYVKHLSNDLFYGYFDSVIKMIEEGLDSLDNVVLITSHQIIYEWGKMYLSMKSANEREMSLDGNQGNNSCVYVLFTKYETNFQKMLAKLFKMLLEGEITSLFDISNSLLVLVLIYNTFYLNLVNSMLIVHFPRESNQMIAKQVFEALFNDVKRTLDDSNLGRFRRNLKEFSIQISNINLH